MLLDVTVLLQSCGGDEDFARELFGEYISASQNCWKT